jgi:formylglycine-generating enzyme required for sulfatase activity
MAASDSDVMVLHNGDLHSGTVAQETFTLETAYGVLEVPYARMAGLYFGKKKHDFDRLVTTDGERFGGRLQQKSLFVIRGVFGVSLDVATTDIDRIEFARLDIPRRGSVSLDAVSMRGGDVFRANVLTSQFMIRSVDGLHLLDRAKVNYLNLDSGENDGETIVEARVSDAEQSIQGTLMNSTLLVKTQHGQDLEIPARIIGAIALKAFAKKPAGTFLPVDLAVRPDRPSLEEFRDRFIDGTLGPRMVPIAAGSYRRGDLSGGGDGDEKPVQSVTIKQPFAIGAYPVTFEEYDRFADEYGRAKPDDQGWGRVLRPAINVSWEDAVSYAKWLSDKTGHTYRLPSDAEWEYAARAGSESSFWWGDEAGTARANCSRCGSLWESEKTSPVGRFPANPLGLYDMAGNVWEWMADCYHDSLAIFAADGSALNKEGCGKRIIRGGAWSFPPKEMRSANRWRDFPTRHSDDTGFRLVRESQ